MRVGWWRKAAASGVFIPFARLLSLSAIDDRLTSMEASAFLDISLENKRT
jgi:hypothetical protein